jgi:AcrR family transcriptional regulator
MSDRRTIGERDDDDPQALPPAVEAVDRRRLRHDAKLARIVGEAWELARRDGLAAISLRELAERVDLRQPSLYAYFDSKLALYDAMFVDAFQHLLEAGAAWTPAEDPHEALVEFVELCVRFATEDVVRHQLMFQRTIPGFKPSPESRELVLAFREIGRQRLSAVGVADLPTADIFTAIVAGLTNQQVFNDPHGDRWLRQTRRVVEMFLADIEQRRRSESARRPARQTNQEA